MTYVDELHARREQLVKRDDRLMGVLSRVNCERRKTQRAIRLINNLLAIEEKEK